MKAQFPRRPRGELYAGSLRYVGAAAIFLGDPEWIIIAPTAEALATKAAQFGITIDTAKTEKVEAVPFVEPAAERRGDIAERLLRTAPELENEIATLRETGNRLLKIVQASIPDFPLGDAEREAMAAWERASK